MELVGGAGFTGKNTKSGELLTLNFRGCKNGANANEKPASVFCALHYDCVLNIKDSGVDFLD